MTDSPSALRARLRLMARAGMDETEMGLRFRAQEAEQKALAHGGRGYRAAAEMARHSVDLYRADPEGHR